MWSCFLRRLRRKAAALVASVAALVALLVPSAAVAAPFVPMCGEQAETIAAPPIVRAVTMTILRASPCADTSDWLTAGTAPDPLTPERSAQADGAPRMPPVWHCLPPLPLSGRIAGDALRSGERAGFARAIDRPPCT